MIPDQTGFLGNRFFKGNLHSHTVNSDGRLTNREAVELYASHGYQFLCFSEHDYYTDFQEELNREDFIILPGVEASAILLDGEGKRSKVHHIHGILGPKAMREAAGDRCFQGHERLEPMIYQGEWDGAGVAQALSDYLKGRGCITMYNHPVWSRVEPQEYLPVKGLWALEVFNYNTVNESNTGYDPVSWDLMLRRGVQIFGTATDDNHNEGLFDDACGGFVMVNADRLDHESILQSLMAGQFYFSAGPEIFRWEIRGGTAVVECSDAVRIDFIAGNHINDGGSILAEPGGKPLVRGEYPLKGDEDYIRVQCTDRQGRMAWSNPFFL